MDLLSILGIIVAFGSLVVGYSIDGGSIGALWLLSAMIIVAGGASGSVMIAYGMDQFKRFPALFISLFKQPKSNMASTVDFLVKLSESARKDGILSLEKIIEAEEGKGKIDPFLKSGIMMVIDGADLEQIKSFLETDIAVNDQKAASEISMFDTMAAFAPAYGMIGTIMGLIQVLANMTSPEAMAAAIAVAFITTLYGVIIANVFCIPASNKLRMRLEYSQTIKEMIIEGICGIRNGDNPKILRERLSPYLVYTASSKKGKDEKVDTKIKKSSINTGAWLNTYADMMNNLLVLFMVLYAMSVMDLEKFRALAQQFNENLSPTNTEVTVPAGAGADPEGSPESEESAQEFDALYEKLKNGIEENGYDEFIELEKGDSFIKFKFKDNVLFYPDSSNMRPDGVVVLQYVGTLLSDVTPYTETIEIGGHTAQTGKEAQITTFAWELSADRAISVLQYLVKNCGLIQSKMSIAGYSHYDPIGDNSTEDGRAVNRRVEIKVIRVTAAPM